ncbi:MAG: hypothetical protein JXQ87_08390 [Bacteroidia bacterium]
MSIALTLIVLSGACEMPDIEVAFTTDAQSYTVGDMVEFDVTITELYDCGLWNIRKPNGFSIYGEKGHEASAAFTTSNTTAEAVEFTFGYNAGYDCDANGEPLGESEKDIFVGQIDFTVGK